MSADEQPHLVTDFVQAIESKLAFMRAHTDTNVAFIDHKRLQPGYRWEPALAQALCRSRCMLLIYNEMYFSREYCVLEFQAMQDLEKKRVGQPVNAMIIPVIVQAAEGRNREPLLPRELGQFQYEDFRSILNPRRQFENLRTLQKVQRISKRLNDLRGISQAPTIDCETYNALKPVMVNPPAEEPFAGTWRIPAPVTEALHP